MKAYYNENDKAAAAWLRELIKAGVIADGDVDERSILEVKAEELAGYRQCHFFAGIGGWSFALRLAGVADDEEVWTGSCPCQPLSSAGLRQGHADERHLWPAFFNLIAQRKPAKVYGEQVASADGREWLAGIRADLEGVGYACGAADLCSAGVGAPNIRQRIYWVADASSGGLGEQRGAGGAREMRHTDERGEAGRLADAKDERSHGRDGITDESTGWARRGPEGCRTPGRLAHADRDGRDQDRGSVGQAGRNGLVGNDVVGRLEHAKQPGLEGHAGSEAHGPATTAGAGEPGPDRMGDAPGERLEGGRWQKSDLSAESGFWTLFDLLPCSDGKARRVESGTFPLAHGVSGRVGLLRGYGNAINPWVAALFIKAHRGIAQIERGEIT